jgi:hypothetical protein
VLGTYLGKTTPENPPIPLNSLFPEDSTDSDEYLAEELDEFFHFASPTKNFPKTTIIEFVV